MFYSVEELIKQISYQALDRKELETKRNQLDSVFSSGAERDEEDARLTQLIATRAQTIRRLLETFLRCPPYHSRHKEKWKAFGEHGVYEKSVFVMTKYPPEDNAAAEPLRKVIGIVQAAVRDYGFFPRLANQAEYHNELWANVELYLLGCAFGIAIVEDCFQPQMNPNVAMEWGWMRACGKPVLFLIEKSCVQKPADVTGLLFHEFDLTKPENKIPQAVTDFLKTQDQSK